MSVIVDVRSIGSNEKFSQKCYIPIFLLKNSDINIGDVIVLKCSSKQFICRVYSSQDPKLSVLVDDVVTVEETTSCMNFSSELCLFPDSFLPQKMSVFNKVKVKVILSNQKHISARNEIICHVIRMVLRRYVIGKSAIVKCTDQLLSSCFHIDSIIILDTYTDEQIFGKISHSANIEIAAVISQEQLCQIINFENAKLGGVGDVMKLLNLNLLGKNRSCNMLLVSGPAGSGKSTLVKKFCCDSKSFFVLIDGLKYKNLTMEKCAAFRNCLIHSSKLFPECPSVLFIDHLDEISPWHSKKKSIESVSAVVSLIKDLNYHGLLTIAAAVHKKLLHPAVSALFRKEITLGMPTFSQRKEILQALTSPVLNCQIDTDKIAQIIPGFVARDISLLVKEAINNSKQFDEKNKKLEVTTEDFLRALSYISPSILKSSAWNVKVKPVFWKDIGGMTEIKKRMQMCIEWPLKNPEVFKQVDLPCPRGVLLFGPPGCCKTTLARGLATECSANFFAANPAQIYSPFVGESEKNITELFSQARLCAPSIIFLDELDSLVGRRKFNSKAQGIGEKVLSVLLNEMDGFGTKMEFQNNFSSNQIWNHGTSSGIDGEKRMLHSADAVIVIAATNRPDLIDDALLRPGRFDVILYIPLPNMKERLSILQTITDGMPLSGVNLDNIAAKTDFFSGADLKYLYNKAALNALRNDMSAQCVTEEDFTHALENMQPSVTREQIQMYEQLASKYGPILKRV